MNGSFSTDITISDSLIYENSNYKTENPTVLNVHNPSTVSSINFFREFSIMSMTNKILINLIISSFSANNSAENYAIL